jgi:hypothetical protein
MCVIQRAVSFGFVVLLATSSVDAQESLAERAQTRDVTVQILSGYAPATFEMLVAESDTIIIGTVTRGQTFPSNDHILTHYDVTVDQVVKPARPPLTRGDTVIVRRAGGATTLEGHNVVGEENDFPQFAVGTKYMLFLQRAERGNYFWVTYGPQGAFQFTDAGVRQVSEIFGSWNRDRGTRVPLDSFIGEIRQSIATQRQSVLP